MGSSWYRPNLQAKLVTTYAVVCLCFLASPAAGQVLVKLRPARDAVLLGEPIYLDVELTNAGDAAVQLAQDPVGAVVGFRVMREGDAEVAGWAPSGSMDGPPPKLVALASGQNVQDRVRLSHHYPRALFASSGAYRVWAEYDYSGLVLHSETVIVKVTEPEGEDLQALSLFGTPEARCFISFGSYGFLGRHGIAPAIGGFEELVQRYPTSSYAPYAAYYLALAKSQSQQYSLGPGEISDPIPPDYARAIELAQFAEARAEFPLKAEARILQAECYFGQGDRQKANAMLQSVGSIPGLAERRRSEALVVKLIQPPQ